MAMRGPGAAAVRSARDEPGEHVFLYRNAPLGKDLIRSRLKTTGKIVGVKVYPHRLRHTCATQLLNAGCRITSIQAFLGHKKLNTTLIYARTHDQTVADDYYAAMSRVEQRLQIGPAAPAEPAPEPDRAQLLSLTEQLAEPALSLEARLLLVAQMQVLLRMQTVTVAPVSFPAREAELN